MPDQTLEKAETAPVQTSIFLLAQRGEFQRILKLYPKGEPKGAKVGIWNVDPHGRNILHIATEYDQLSKVPKELFIEDLILTKTNQGENLLHLAASYGGLKYIPKLFLSIKNLSLRDRDGKTTFHHAANQGCIKEIPENALNERSLLLCCKTGPTVLEEALYELLSRHNRDRKLADKLTNKLRLKALIHLKNKGSGTHPAIKKYLNTKIQLRMVEDFIDSKNKTLSL